VDTGYLKLRFFRDIPEWERIALLKRFGEIPEDYNEPVSQAVQNTLLSRLIRNGEAEAIDAALPKPE
jgi:hypothetical protein